MAIDPDLTLLRKKIRKRLTERRPDRYNIRASETDADEDEENDDTGSEWLDEVADEFADEVPAEHASQLYARKLVGQIEGSATRSANSLLRKMAQTGQLLISWMDYAREPIAISWEEERDGRPFVREERVALGAATAGDLERWELVERRRAAKDAARRNEACDGAQIIAAAIRAGGFGRFDEWAEGEAEEL